MKTWTSSPLLLLALVLAFSSTAIADVMSKGPGGFILQISADVPVSAEEAYNQFVNIGEWWDPSHSYYGDSANFSLEQKAGGCFCEKSGANEVMHMLVTYVKPGVELRMTGGLGPLQMMGVHGGMSWSFADLGGGNSRITQTYNVTGYIEDGFDMLAEVVNQVQTGQLNRLVSKLIVD